MSSTTLNPPPPTPVRGTRIVVADLVRELNEPLVDLFHPACCVLCDGAGHQDTASAFVDLVADEIAAQYSRENGDPDGLHLTHILEDPPLTQGQKRVFEGERARLFRMLDARTPAKDAAVLELLDDMAGQAPAVDAVIAAENARRRETAQARPTLALALTRNRGRS